MFPVSCIVNIGFLSNSISHTSSIVSMSNPCMTVLSNRNVQSLVMEMHRKYVSMSCCRDAMMAYISFHENLIVQQIKHRRNNANNQHNGYSRPPSHAPVCPIIWILSLWGFILNVSQQWLLLLLLDSQGGHNLIQAAPGWACGFNKSLNVFVLLLEESFHAVCGRGGVCGGLQGKGGNGGDLGQGPGFCGGGRFERSSAVTFSQHAEAPHRNLNWPQGKEVLLRQ